MTLLRIKKDSVLYGHPEVIDQEVEIEIVREEVEQFVGRGKKTNGFLVGFKKQHWEIFPPKEQQQL